MQVTLPQELVEDIVVQELSSFLQELTEMKEALEEGTYTSFPTYSTNLDEEYTEVVRDYKACFRMLQYYKGNI